MPRPNILDALDRSFRCKNIHLDINRNSEGGSSLVWCDMYRSWNAIGTTPCKTHLCHCGKRTHTTGLHVLLCRKHAGWQQQHNMWNNIIRRLLGRANNPSQKEPLGLTREDGKWPDGVTVILWSYRRCLTWEVTISNAFETSHLASISTEWSHKRGSHWQQLKYSTTIEMQAFVVWHWSPLMLGSSEGLTFALELKRRLTDITHDTLKTGYLFQRLLVPVQCEVAICLSLTLSC